ncbi:MAG: hypothetical protein KC591_10855 [Gemmatimonadetes bacterium]|nr:hypothetical protein [Gemmatimonadota bacterium]
MKPVLLALALLILEAPPLAAGALADGSPPASGAAGAGGEGASIPPPSEQEARFESLARRYDELSGQPPVAEDWSAEAKWVEAESIASVAEELFEEGEIEVASDLLEEAVALLALSAPADSSRN